MYADGASAPGLVAAWLVLGNVAVERVPWWAAEWLASGHDGPALRELAGLGRDDSGQVWELLPAALAETRVRLPATAAAAAAVWFTHIARLCLADRIAEREVAQLVEQTVRMCDYADEVADLPLGRLYGVNDEWAGSWGPSVDELRAEVRAACTRQVADGG